MTPEQKVAELRRSILEWNDAYYDDGTSPVTDAVYDAAKMELAVLEVEHPHLATKDSPTQTVGDVSPATRRSYSQAPHHVPMLSLNTQVDTSIEPIKKLLADVWDLFPGSQLKLVAEPKYDGLGLDLQYVDGKLDKAVTRGDGMIGEDVTHLIRYFSSNQIPMELRKKITMDVRGEVLISKEDFNKLITISETGVKRTYMNARNAAAGLMRMIDPVSSHKFLSFMAYDVAWTAQDRSLPDSHMDRMDYLCLEGFHCMYTHISGEIADNVAPAIYEVYKTTEAERADLKYEIDGMVYKVDSWIAREAMGFTGREPNWAIAHKFPAEQVETEVLDVIIETGRTGRVTPVAILKPVLCGGVIISRANLVHAGRIKELGIRIGSRVIVQRAGDVVPEVVRVITDPKTDEDHMDTLHLFSSCPSCGGPLSKDKAIYYCLNTSNCKAQLVNLLLYAASRPLLNIKGLGEAAIVRLVDTEDLKDVAGLFLLNEEKLVYAGLAKTQAVEVLGYIKAALKAPAYKVMASLGIATLGRTNSTTLLDHYGTLVNAFGADVETMVGLKGISKVVATNIHDGFTNSADIITKLLSVPGAEWSHVSNVSNGLSVCVSGSFPGFTRDSLNAALTKVGFAVTSKVTSKTDLFIAGEGAAASKVAEAAKLGKETITDIDALIPILEGKVKVSRF